MRRKAATEITLCSRKPSRNVVCRLSCVLLLSELLPFVQTFSFYHPATRLRPALELLSPSRSKRITRLLFQDHEETEPSSSSSASETTEVNSQDDVSPRIAALCAKQKEFELQKRENVSVSSPETPYWRQALTLLQQNADDPSLSSASYNAVLRFMARQRNVWKDALGLLRRMEQSSLSTLPSYRLVIECCVASNQSEQAAQVLQACIRHQPVQDMDRSDKTMLIHMFEVVMGALSRKLQWRRAVQLLDVLENDLHLPATMTAYNSLLTACSKAREVVQCKNLLVRMRKPPSQLKPNIKAFNSVMACCANANRWKDALSVFDQCHREPGVTPDIYTYTNAIRACGKGGKTQRALSLLEVAKDKGLPVDTYCYTAALDACAKARQWKKALDLLDEMKEAGIEPSAVTYSVAISACGNGGQWQKALEVLDVMRKKNLSINLITYNAAITALSKAAKQQSHKSSQDGQLWTRVMGLLDQMKSDGLEPDGFTFSSAIACCGAEGRWEEALHLIELMQDGGPRTRPNRVSEDIVSVLKTEDSCLTRCHLLHIQIAYTAAISSCGRSGQVEHALRLFRQMKEQGLSADRVAYNALFSALRVAKKADEAYELWKEMCGAATSGHGSPPRRATARSEASTRPDIITLTEVLGAMSASSSDPRHRERVDEVFADAVERGIVLKDKLLDVPSEVDLSGLSLPVARAACCFVIHNRVLESSDKSEDDAISLDDDLTFVTGMGASRGHGHSNDNKDERFTSLREFVQEVLVTDFDPPLVSTIPIHAQGTVQIDKATLRQWYDQHNKA